jgi:sarcosine oxidase subunit gamma
MDIAVVSKPALAGVKTGRHGASAGEAGIRIEALPEGFVLHVLVRPGDQAAAEGAKALASRLGTPLRGTAPGQWYIASDRAMTPEEFRKIEAEHAPGLAFSEQGHGRVRIAISGAPVEAVLAKLMAVDLTLAAYPIGHGTTLFAGHVSVHAQRTEAQRFELMVLRSFAVDLWESLVQASAEFGVDCIGPA